RPRCPYPLFRRRQGAWWAPRSSKPVCRRELAGGFDSRPPPPRSGLGRAHEAPGARLSRPIGEPVEVQRRAGGEAPRHLALDGRRAGWRNHVSSMSETGGREVDTEAGRREHTAPNTGGEETLRPPSS